jgi:predicted GNAT family acetyltransferase
VTIPSGNPAETVRDNRFSRRFEASVDGHTAFLQYKLEPGEITLVHTEVPPSLRGRGWGNGLRVRALCPFVQAYVRKHPEFRPLLSEGDSEAARRSGRA